MHRHLILTMLGTLALVAACSSSAPDSVSTVNETQRDEGSRSLATEFRFGQIDLSTPERVVEELIAAHRDDDHLRSLLFFSGSAQMKFRDAFALSERGLWQDQYPRTTYTLLGNAEHNTYDLLPQLAQAMELADQDGLLVVDLTSASIGASTTVDETKADVRLTVAEGSDIVVRTVEVSEGEWRVAQLVLDGLEPDLSGPPILRRTCPLSRIVTLDGAECPESEREGFSDVAAEDVPPEVQAEIDRLRAEAGTDINAQIAIARPIAELLEPFDARMKRPTDAEICGAMQGVSDYLIDWESVGDTRDRAEALLGTTCPGSIDLLFTDVDTASTVERFPETSLYGGLPLSSPEASVNAFFESWSNEAYLSAYLVLSPRAQSAMISDGLLTEAGRGAASWDLDHGFPVMWAVEKLAETASMEGAHRLGSSDDVKIGSTSSIAWLDRDGDPIEGRAVDVVVDGVPYTVAVTESPSGRWRVTQIVRAPDDPNPSGPVFPAEA